MLEIYDKYMCINIYNIYHCKTVMCDINIHIMSALRDRTKWICVNKNILYNTIHHLVICIEWYLIDSVIMHLTYGGHLEICNIYLYAVFMYSYVIFMYSYVIVIYSYVHVISSIHMLYLSIHNHAFICNIYQNL